MDAGQVHREAVARVLARRCPARFRTVQGPHGEVRVPADDVSVSEFLDPHDASEWLDDRLARTPPGLGPWTGVLYEVAEAARHGAEAAVAAVGAARELGAWDTWHLYCTLQAWRSQAIPAVTPVLRAVHAEWERLRLADAEPTETPLPVAPEPKRPKVRYATRWGQPAGMAI
jgi:hypothetical protein